LRGIEICPAGEGKRSRHNKRYPLLPRRAVSSRWFRRRCIIPCFRGRCMTTRFRGWCISVRLRGRGEMVDARDLKSLSHKEYGFESHRPHHNLAESAFLRLCRGQQDGQHSANFGCLGPVGDKAKPPVTNRRRLCCESANDNSPLPAVMVDHSPSTRPRCFFRISGDVRSE
jgi:hypothetical protein